MTPDDDMSLRSILERHTLVAAQYRAALSRRLGLGATATAALLHFAHQSPLTLGQLGQMLVVSSRDASAAIEQLEERGWLSACRDHDGDSLRAYALTSEGAEQLGACLLPLIERVDAVSAQLSTWERAAVMRFISKVAAIDEAHRDASAHDVIEGSDPL